MCIIRQPASSLLANPTHDAPAALHAVLQISKLAFGIKGHCCTWVRLLPTPEMKQSLTRRQDLRKLMEVLAAGRAAAQPLDKPLHAQGSNEQQWAESESAGSEVGEQPC